MKIEKRTKRVFKKTYALKLIKAGHNLLDMETNLRDNRFKVYVFEDTKELQQNLHELILETKEYYAQNPR